MPRTTPESFVQQTPVALSVWAEEVEKRRNELTDAHYAVIGRVATEWAFFERMIDNACIDLAGVDPQIGFCFAANMLGTRSKLQAFISLIKHLGVKGWELELDEFFKVAQKLGNKRNRTVHDPWSLEDPEHPVRREASAEQKLRLGDVEMPTEEVRTICDSIIEHQKKFGQLVSRAAESLRALRQTSLETQPSQQEP